MANIGEPIKTFEIQPENIPIPQPVTAPTTTPAPAPPVLEPVPA